MAFCMKNNVIGIRITTLYESQPSFVALVWKTATLALELQVSMGARLPLWFFDSKQRL